jgi:hypothetical protein
VTLDYYRIWHLQNAYDYLILGTNGAEGSMAMYHYISTTAGGLTYPGGASAAGSGLAQLDRWTLMCGMVSGTTVSTYINRNAQSANYNMRVASIKQVNYINATEGTFTRLGHTPGLERFLHGDLASFTVYNRSLFPSEIDYLLANPPPAVVAPMRVEPVPTHIQVGQSLVVNIICPTWFGEMSNGSPLASMTVSASTSGCTIVGSPLVFSGAETKSFIVNGPASGPTTCVISFTPSGISDTRIGPPSGFTLAVGPTPSGAQLQTSANFALLFPIKPAHASTWLGGSGCKPRNIVKFLPANHDYVDLTSVADIGAATAPFPNAAGGTFGGVGVAGGWAFATWFQFHSLQNVTWARVFDIAQVGTVTDGVSLNLFDRRGVLQAETAAGVGKLVAPVANAVVPNKW